MGFFSGLGKMIKPLVNVPKWMHARQLANNGKSLVEIGKTIFVPEKAEYQESFDQAMQRLGLSEADITQRKQEFLRLAFIFGVIAFLIFSYTIYLFSYGYTRAGTLALLICFIALVQVFRNHFWYTQIRVRRLGLSFRDWVNIGILGKNK